MKLIKYFLLICLIATPCYAGNLAGIVSVGGAVAGACTKYLEQTGKDNFINVDSLGAGYGGQFDYTPSGNKTICQIDFSVHSITGNVSAKTYNMYIFAHSGVNLGAQVGKSDNKTGVTTGFNTFTFTTNPTLTSGTPYAIVLGSTDDANNYVSMDIISTGTTFGVTVANWYVVSEALANTYTPYTATMKLYAQ